MVPRHRNDSNVMQWFRFYSEVVHDPKVQKLSGTMFKHWVNVLCLANANEPRGLVPMPSDVAYALRISEGRAVVLLDELLALHLLEPDDEGALYPHNWEERQPLSDDAAARMAKKRRTRSEHVRTRQDKNRTEQETDTEKEESKPRVLPSGDDFVLMTKPFVPDEEGLVGEWRRNYETSGAGLFTWGYEAERLVKEFSEDEVRSAAMHSGWTKHPNWLRSKLAGQRLAAATPVATVGAAPLKNGRYDD